MKCNCPMCKTKRKRIWNENKERFHPLFAIENEVRE